ncbi:MAG: OsmC family protein [Woeseiaceae bacterium]
MQDLPHHYQASATAFTRSNVEVTSRGLEALETAGPAEFGGPGDLWSPETMLVGAVANCFILSFRAIARAARLDWASLTVDVEGVLDRVEKVTRFTRFVISAQLEVERGVDEEKARKLLAKAKKHCLISNSMLAECELSSSVEFVVNAD